MARLQILYLPSKSVGEFHEPQFALVVDQLALAELPDHFAAQVEEFGVRIGAAGTLVTPITLDITQGQEDADPDVVITWDHREVVNDVVDVLRKRVESQLKSQSVRDLASRG